MSSAKSIKKSASGMRGFSRGLMAEKILGVTDCPGELYFLIKVGIWLSIFISILPIILILVAGLWRGGFSSCEGSQYQDSSGRPCKSVKGKIRFFGPKLITDHFS